MDMKLKFKNKRGLSAIITTVILIALVMVAGVIVWGVVRGIVQGKLEGVESCFGIYEKVTINSMYTCYDSADDEFHFSINVGDINLEKVVVSVSGTGATNSYILTNEDQQSIGLTLYPSGGEVKLPGKNAGLTYVASMPTKPDLIKIAPGVDGQLCEVSDSLADIDDCSITS